MQLVYLCVCVNVCVSVKGQPQHATTPSHIVRAQVGESTACHSYCSILHSSQLRTWSTWGGSSTNSKSEPWLLYRHLRGELPTKSAPADMLTQ